MEYKISINKKGHYKIQHHRKALNIFGITLLKEKWVDGIHYVVKGIATNWETPLSTTIEEARETLKLCLNFINTQKTIKGKEKIKCIMN